MSFENCLVFLVLLGAVSCYYGPQPVRFPSSGLRLRTLRPGRYPTFRSYSRILPSRPSYVPFGRSRVYSDLNDLNNNNNFRFPSLLRGRSRGIRLSGSRIIPRRIRIPLRMQRGRGSSIPLNPRISTGRRIPIIQRSRSIRLPSRRITRRRFTGIARRPSSGMRRQSDEVLALLAFDDTPGHVRQPSIGSKVTDGVDFKLPVPAEFVEQAPIVEGLPIKSESIAVIAHDDTSKLSSPKELISDAVKAKIDDIKISETKFKKIDTIEGIKKIEKIGKIAPITIGKEVPITTIDDHTVIGGTHTVAALESKVKKTEQKVEKIISEASMKKVKIVAAPILDATKDTLVIKDIAKKAKLVGAAVVKDTVVAADAYVAAKAPEIKAKADIKISDVDTVNIKADVIVAPGNGTGAAVVAAPIVDKKLVIAESVIV